jgi:hypothetical protein
MGDDRNLYINVDHVSAIKGNGLGRSLIYLVGNNFPAFEVEGDLEDVAEIFDTSVVFRIPDNF